MTVEHNFLETGTLFVYLNILNNGERATPSVVQYQVKITHSVRIMVRDP